MCWNHRRFANDHLITDSSSNREQKRSSLTPSSWGTIHSSSKKKRSCASVEFPFFFRINQSFSITTESNIEVTRIKDLVINSSIIGKVYKTVKRCTLRLSWNVSGYGPINSKLKHPPGYLTVVPCPRSGEFECGKSILRNAIVVYLNMEVSKVIIKSSVSRANNMA